MRDTVLWRKQSRVIMLLAETLRIDAEQAMGLIIVPASAGSWRNARAAGS